MDFSTDGFLSTVSAPHTVAYAMKFPILFVSFKHLGLFISNFNLNVAIEVGDISSGRSSPILAKHETEVSVDFRRCRIVLSQQAVS